MQNQNQTRTYHCYCSVYDEHNTFIDNCFVTFRSTDTIEQLEQTIQHASGIYEHFTVYYTVYSRPSPGHSEILLVHRKPLTTINTDISTDTTTAIYLDAHATLRI